MLKSIIALCVTSCLMVPMIAQADAGIIEHPALFAHYELDQAVPAVLATVNQAVTCDRSVLSQPEAAVIASKSSQANIGNGIDQEVVGLYRQVSTPFEVAWRG